MELVALCPLPGVSAVGRSHALRHLRSEAVAPPVSWCLLLLGRGTEISSLCVLHDVPVCAFLVLHAVLLASYVSPRLILKHLSSVSRYQNLASVKKQPPQKKTRNKTHTNHHQQQTHNTTSKKKTIARQHKSDVQLREGEISKKKPVHEDPIHFHPLNEGELDSSPTLNITFKLW